MDKTQNSKLSMYAVMVLFFAKYSTVFTTFTALITEITGFGVSKGNLDAEIALQSSDSTGVTADKNALVITAITQLVKFARKGRVWAFKNGNLTLEHLFDVRKTDYLEMHEGAALDALVTVRDGLNNNITALAAYNVLPINITAIDNAISAAKASMGTPQVAIQSKIVSTAAIVNTIKTIDGHLELIDDLLIPEYEGIEANSTMLEAYLLGRELAPIGHNHSGVHAVCTDSISKALLEGVNMEIVELKKNATSTILGVADIIKCKSGTYHLKFTLAGYQDYNIIITIHVGKITDIEVMMVKVVVS